MAPRRPSKRTRKDPNPYPYPTAPQIRDAYSQLPTHFGRPSPSSLRPGLNSSASGSNSVPLPTPEEVEMKRQITDAWRVREGREKGSRFVDIGGFRVPAPPPPEIEGRSGEENKMLAEGMRMLLEDDVEDEEEAPPTEMGSLDFPHTQKKLSRSQHEREALSKAFQQEYCLPHHPDLTKSRTPAQLYLPQDLDENADHEQDQDKAPLEPEPEYHDRRHRDSIIAGQEIGLGVIGSSHPVMPTRITTSGGKEYLARVIEGDHGCDTPMYQFLDQKRGVPIPSTSLDLDLPSLAIEHPARMWNSLIHSLDAEMQPIAKWRYERSADEEGWIAHLTLALPPTHPSIKQHPLYMTVPKNIRSQEYINVIELLGGVRRWSGESKKLKAEAQNTALVRCMADNAISWIYAPSTSPVPADADRDVKDVEGGVGVSSDEIIIDEEMLEDPYEVGSTIESSPPSNVFENNQEMISVPVHPDPLNIGEIEYPSSINVDPLEFEAVTHSPDAEGDAIDSIQSPDSTSSAVASLKPPTTGHVSDLGIETRFEGCKPGCRCGTYSDHSGDSSKSYDRLMSDINQAHEDYPGKFYTEFVVHKMPSLEEHPNLYFCHLLIAWPKEGKTSVWCDEASYANVVVAKEAISDVVFRDCMDTSSDNLYQHTNEFEDPLEAFIALCHTKGLGSPRFGARIIKNKVCGQIKVGGVELTDSKSRLHWKYWDSFAEMIMKLVK